MVHIDLVGAFPDSQRGNKYILSIIDRYTKYLVLIKLPDMEAQTISKHLLDYFIYIYGPPDTLLSDRGTQFLSELFKTFTKLLKIRTVHTTSYQPQTNGVLERVHSYIKSIYRCLGIEFDKDFSEYENNDWDEYLSYLCYNYNTSIHSSTGFCPYELVFGRIPKSPYRVQMDLDNLDQIKNLDFNIFIKKLRRVIQYFKKDVNEYRDEYDRKRKEFYDNKYKPIEYQVDDIVIVYHGNKYVGNEAELKQQWIGPFKIIHKYSKVLYKIESCEFPELSYKMHGNKLKIYYPRRDTT